MQETHIIYVTHLIPQKLSDEEKETIAWISTHLGEKSWQNALVIFINTSARKSVRNSASILKQRSLMLRTAIAAHAGWDIASSILTVMIQAREDPLTDSQRWLQEYKPPGGTSGYLLILEGTREMIALPITSHDPQQRRKPERAQLILPGYAKTLAGCYLSSVPLTAVGLFVAGILGYEIAMLSNILFWIVISFVRVR